MELDIERSLLLCHMRQRKANKLAGRLPHQGLTTKKGLSKLIWPGTDKSDVYMSGLINGNRKGIPRESVRILCHELVVDPNFLFGFPSVKHDPEYFALLQEK